MFLSCSLINYLYEFYKSPQIDLLVNDDTIQLAKLLPNVYQIHSFSYEKKRNNQWLQEKNIIASIYNQYDLSINLTASDRSVIYAILAGKISISAIEKTVRKSWWKKMFLSDYYYFDSNKHILFNNLEPLRLLNIEYQHIQKSIQFANKDYVDIKSKLDLKGIKKFIIFHPSAQYKYKIYPKNLRDKLLELLSTLGVPIIVTGGNSQIDLSIKKEIPALPNIFNFIGKTSLKDYFILSELALGYIGMDTLNMHIASSQNKKIFAIFGPTNLAMWSPWSNYLEKSASINSPIQVYGENMIFQANFDCVACGKAGCNGNGKSECLENINPKKVFEQVEIWYKDV